MKTIAALLVALALICGCDSTDYADTPRPIELKEFEQLREVIKSLHSRRALETKDLAAEVRYLSARIEDLNQRIEQVLTDLAGRQDKL